MANRIILNQTSYHGAGAIKELPTEVKSRGLKKALICCEIGRASCRERV